MHLQSVEYIFLVLCHLWHPLMSQLTTSGQMYELVSGKDTDDNTSSFEKFIAYFECGQDDGCGYVAKEKSSGMFVKGTIGKAMNISKYSAMWKKRISDINECASGPCPGRSCIDKIGGYQCICPSGYYGEECNKNINECASSPCVNNGTCVDKINGYQCVCSSGYSGETCNIDINECASSPCSNGTCVDKINGYQCVCSSGYSGKTCNIDINECASNPCANGTCVDKINGYQCICSSGYSGPTCSTDINECASSPCVNGSCVDKINGYQCICSRTYRGERCRKKKKSCLDVYKDGIRENGKFFILGSDDVELEVFCDFQSETNSTWTLLSSFELNNISHFRVPYYISHPERTSDPNWKYYRIDKPNMESIQNYTTLWRMTCDFKAYGVDYRDYVRGKKEELNVITFAGSNVCKRVEYVNVRGHNCSQCTVPFFQLRYHNLHIDSRATSCEFRGNIGSVYSEDNFGHYNSVNTAFRCTRNQQTTTQLWFGDYV